MRLTPVHTNAATYDRRCFARCARSVVSQPCRGLRAAGQPQAQPASLPSVRQVQTAAGVGGLFGSKPSQAGFKEAAAAAEAAQQALTTDPSSPLAPYLQDRPHLADLCRTYGRLQHLYHRKLQQQLEQWGGSKPEAGITVLEYIKLVRRVVSERAAGWSMDLGLVQLSARETGTSDRLTKLGWDLADNLKVFVNQRVLPDHISALVLPDLVTLITKGGSAAAGNCRDALGLPKAPTSDIAAAEQLLLQVLVSLGLPASHTQQLVDNPGQLPLLPGNEEQAGHAGAVLLSAKRLHLPVLFAMTLILEDGTPAEQQQLADLHLEVLQLASVVHTNPLRDAPQELLASGWSAPYTFVQLVAASWATNTMMAETWQQVQGARPVGDWSCLKLVMGQLQGLLLNSPLESWVAVNNKLLLRTVPSGPVREGDIFPGSSPVMDWAHAATFVFTSAVFYHRKMENDVASALDQLEQMGWDEVQLARARRTSDEDLRKVALQDMPDYQASLARVYLLAWNALVAFQGAGFEVLSSTRALSPYLVYWQELALMAVQRGPGTPAALQLAQQLMQERQAVFVYRSAMQVAGLCMASPAAFYDWVMSDQWCLPALTRSNANAAARAAAQAAKHNAPDRPAPEAPGSVDDALRRVLQRIASIEITGEEGLGLIIRALGTGQAAGLVQSASRIHAVSFTASGSAGLPAHMWYLYATAQNLLQQVGLLQQVQSVLVGPGALPEATIRVCAQLGDMLELHQQRLLQAAFLQLNPFQLTSTSHHLLYSGSVRSVSRTSAPDGDYDPQPHQAVRLSSVAYVVGGNPTAEDMLLISVGSMLLQPTQSSSSTQAGYHGALPRSCGNMVSAVVVHSAGCPTHHQQALQMADLVDQHLTDRARAVVSPKNGSVWADAAVEAARRGVLLLEGLDPLQLVQAPPPSTGGEQPVLLQALDMLATMSTTAAAAACTAPAAAAAGEPSTAAAEAGWEQATEQLTATAAAAAVVQLAVASPQRPLAVQQAVLSAMVDHWAHADQFLSADAYAARHQQMLVLLGQLQQQDVLLLSQEALQQLQEPGLKLSLDQLVAPGASLAWVDSMLLSAAKGGNVTLVLCYLRVAGGQGWQQEKTQLPSAAEAAQQLKQRPVGTDWGPSARLDVWAAQVLLGHPPGPARVQQLLSTMEPAAAAAAAAAGDGDIPASTMWLQLQQRLQDIQQLAGPAVAVSTLCSLIAAAGGAELAVALFKQLQQVQQETVTAAAVGLTLGACNQLLQLISTAAGPGSMSSTQAALILQALELTELGVGDTPAAAAAAAAAATTAGNSNSTAYAPASLAAVVLLSPAAQGAAMRAYAALGLDAAVAELVKGSDGQLLAPAVAAWHARVFQDPGTSKEVVLTLQPFDTDTPAPVVTTPPQQDLLQQLVEPTLQQQDAGTLLQVLQLMASSTGSQQPGVQAAMGLLTQQQAAAAAAQLLQEKQYVVAAEQLLEVYVLEGYPLSTDLLLAYAAAAAEAGCDGDTQASAAAQRVLGVLGVLQMELVAEALQAALSSNSSSVSSSASSAVPILEALLAAITTGPNTAAAAAGSPGQAASMSPELLVSLVTYKCTIGTAEGVEQAGQLLEGWLDAGKGVPAAATAAFVAAVAPRGHTQLQARLLTLAAGAGQLVEVLTCLLSQQSAGAAVAAVLTQLAGGCAVSAEQQQQQLLEPLMTQLHAVANQQCQAGEWQVVQQLLSSSMQLGLQLAPTAAAAYLDHLASTQAAAAAPATAAAALQLLGTSRSDVPAAGAPAAASAATTLQLSTVAAYLVKQDVDWLTGWEQQLAPTTAAAVLFSCWAWTQPGPPAQLVALYNSIRQLQGVRELLLPGLVCEVALAAAGQAGDWDTAEAIINAAQKQHQQEAASNSSGSGGSGVKKQRAASPSEPWVPTLPAALAAWAAVQVHTPPNNLEGVQKGKQLLLDACMQVRASKQQQHSSVEDTAAAAAGRKKKAASKPAAVAAAPSKDAESAAGRAALLQPGVVNAVLLAMLQRGVGDPAATSEAAAAAAVVTEQLLGCSIPDAARGQPLTPAAPGCLPDGHTWALLLRLWGAAQPFTTTSTSSSVSPAALLAAACSRQLPVLGGSSTWDAAAVQELAAAGVAGLRAAGRQGEALGLVQLLGKSGVMELSSGLLALEVMRLLTSTTAGSGADCVQLTDELLELLEDDEEGYFKLEEAAEAAQAELAAAASCLNSHSSEEPGQAVDQGACMAAYALLLQQHQQRKPAGAPGGHWQQRDSRQGVNLGFHKTPDGGPVQRPASASCSCSNALAHTMVCTCGHMCTAGVHAF